MRLKWHDYRYYPYERELAAREAAMLFNRSDFREIPGGLELKPVEDTGPARRLTYFSAALNGRAVTETQQSRLERSARVGRTRQATRYSVHGLHEYKGKFNPQVVKSLLNVLEIGAGNRVLDPFCGSGTTLVECAHAKVLGVGIDINPFAVFLANVKLQALVTPVTELRAAQPQIFRRLKRRSLLDPLGQSARIAYLRSWFTPEVLGVIETLRTIIEDSAGAEAPVFLAVASDLLRDYSQQDPKDLRIRRRKTPLPDVPFVDAFTAACDRFFERLEAAQAILGTKLPRGRAERRDAATLAKGDVAFDAAITSPPYAMALPYIDTQRLSLIWLGLLEPKEVSRVESDLIGSREFRGDARRAAAAALSTNEECLPDAEAAFCLRLQESLADSDGFRRRAVPTLLYRYLASMRRCFRAVRRTMRPGAPFALIVGHNHTVLGGVRHEIDTPTHLAALAADAGWTVEELLPLQTYRRYGYHVSNAVRKETLAIFRNS